MLSTVLRGELAEGGPTVAGRVPMWLRDALDDICARDRMSLSSVVRAALFAYVIARNLTQDERR